LQTPEGTRRKAEAEAEARAKAEAEAEAKAEAESRAKEETEARAIATKAEAAALAKAVAEARAKAEEERRIKAAAHKFTSSNTVQLLERLDLTQHIPAFMSAAAAAARSSMHPRHLMCDSAFRKEKVTDDVISNHTVDDLKRLGLSLGEARLFLSFAVKWCTMAAGGTTLHGTSDQKFGAEQAFNPYASKAVVYSVRLVADADEKISPQTWGQCLHLSKAGAAQEEI
jgi:hypothetical protein